MGVFSNLRLLPGVFQSLLLGHRVGALAWSATHLIGLGAGVLVAFPVMLTVAALFGWSVPSPQAWALAGLLVGTVYGTVTWRVLEPTSATGTPGGMSDSPVGPNGLAAHRPDRAAGTGAGLCERGFYAGRTYWRLGAESIAAWVDQYPPVAAGAEAVTS